MSRFLGYSDTRDFFTAVREAVDENRNIAARIAYLKQKNPRRDEKVKASATDINAMGSIDDALEYEAFTKHMVASNEKLRQLCVNVMDGVKAALGTKYGEVVYFRVINAHTWKQVAACMNYSRTAVIGFYNVVCDYCDSVGAGRAKDGDEV